LYERQLGQCLARVSTWLDRTFGCHQYKSLAQDRGRLEGGTVSGQKRGHTNIRLSRLQAVDDLV
jgi:hypothetical protein